MKIVAYIESQLLDGGGFCQSLSALEQLRKITAEMHCLEVWTPVRANCSILASLGFVVRFNRLTSFDRFVLGLENLPVLAGFLRRLGVTSVFENRLRRVNCDLVYFVSPSPVARLLFEINYFATVWDLAHKLFPEFPEVRARGEFSARERLFRGILPRAVGVMADSESLAELISRFYGVEFERIVPMPFSPNPFLATESQNSGGDAAILAERNVKRGYFFYPAQFWPHKNHIRIVEALGVLSSQGYVAHVVFVGGDKGSMQHVRNFAEQRELSSRVSFLGFVSSDELACLYRNCLAVVMPTYFGPTNIPPLEAWLFEKPLVYSMHLSAQAGDAALLVDPDDANSLAEGMLQALNDETRKVLIENGRRRLREVERERKQAEVRFREMIATFGARRSCWS